MYSVLKRYDSLGNEFFVLFDGNNVLKETYWEEWQAEDAANELNKKDGLLSESL
jgi:hypothetical protein